MRGCAEILNQWSTPYVERLFFEVAVEHCVHGPVELFPCEGVAEVGLEHLHYGEIVPRLLERVVLVELVPEGIAVPLQVAGTGGAAPSAPAA